MGIWHECSKCKKLKFRRYVLNKSGRYADEHGKMWNGFECPACKIWAKDVPKSNKIRQCRACGKDLPADLYFRHRECRPDDYNQFVDWSDTGRGLVDTQSHESSFSNKSNYFIV